MEPCIGLQDMLLLRMKAPLLITDLCRMPNVEDITTLSIKNIKKESYTTLTRKTMTKKSHKQNPIVTSSTYYVVLGICTSDPYNDI